MSAAAALTMTANGVTYRGSWSSGAGGTSYLSIIIQPGATYNLSSLNVTSVLNWVEMF